MSGLRVLILGGTGFIGPRFVTAALERGHQVSVFNRGRANDRLPDDVEQLVGDRVTDLGAIAGRNWDAVMDLAAFVPGWVRRLGEVLSGRVGHYTFISTHYVYQPPTTGAGVIEDMPVRDYTGESDPFELESLEDGRQYGALKVLSEHEAERWFPGRVLVLRPGYITGPGDPQPFLSYLPLRMERGGEMLVPGDPSTEVQFVDSRDLAEFAIRQAEVGGTGTFNMAGPRDRTSIATLLDASADVTGTRPESVWMPSSWLASRDAAYWLKPLFWSPDGISAWVTPTANDKARAAGATFRPISETLAVVYADAKQTAPERDGAQHLTVTDASGARRSEAVPWDDYLEREREAIAAWRAEEQGPDPV